VLLAASGFRLQLFGSSYSAWLHPAALTISLRVLSALGRSVVIGMVRGIIRFKHLFRNRIGVKG